MRAGPVAALLLLTTGLAGCLSDDQADDTGARGRAPDASRTHADFPALSPSEFGALPVEEIWVASSVDGKRMYNAVYRPDTDEAVPVFINFSPYWGDTAETGGDAFSQYLIAEYVPRGYAVVLSAVRGTGHSEGCFQIAGDLELQDTYDVVDFFANEDWSNGNVGAGGKSYDSTTQNGMLAKFPHPALKTTFHVSGITDMYRYNYRYGVPYGQGTIFNTYYYFQGTDEYGVGLFGEPASPERLAEEDAESLARLIDDVACTELPQMQASGVGSGAHGMKDAYWIERDWTRTIADSSTQGSIFFVHGFQDWNVKPDNILPWLANLPDDVVVKTWLHQDTDNLGHVYPMRQDWNVTMLRWLDHFLKGIDTGILDEPLFESEGSDGVWRAGDAWPAAVEQADMVAFPLADVTEEDGMLGPLLAGAVLEAGNDPFRYAGAPQVTLTATSTHADPVLTAVLYDESPSGERTWVNEAVLRGAYRDGLETPEPVEPGTVTTYTLEFYPGDQVLAPGHRWVLVLGATPREAVPTPAQLTGIEYDAAGATLYLPLASAAGALTVQPETSPCWAC